MARLHAHEDGHDRKSRQPGRPGLPRRTLLTGTAALVGTGAVAGASSGCSRVATADTGDGGQLLQQLRAKGTVRLGIAGEQPYGYIGEDGEVTGSAPAIATRIFRRLGVDHVEPFPTEFGSLIFGLNSLQFDVVAAGMYINPERCEQVLFADPEYQMKDAFIVPRGNPKKLRTYADIARTGARMATGIGYAEIDYAEAAGVKRIDTLPDQLAGLLAVEQGRVDVFAGTAVTVRNVVEQTGSTKAEATDEVTPIVDGKPVIDVGGFAFRMPERNLRDAFNRELHKMKRSGELLEVMRPFGFTKDQMTDIRAEEKCRP
ncbi:MULTISPECIES: ectoine/hydroxyectoine ABC transporter substrate-binding protein EhuB [Streptomyces]|uniref:Ectoine/hydroxyectoine ABC transporter substrate-binding protein EhuB n=1 Tax=Streptomyces griseiscabiei TaxID=2993540 RepID=A0ABU4KZM6_9ACTN|nr:MULTISPECIES: ectoine/hydroxyectoine ABC transporter substrate-binding protein EhuB [Streptomyces]MBZ3900998.1 ectoine/hydroxyectoine ABC transporter substrate-binding protein EhuB [Streptomyces griseiscabiei]MDX2908871.1 ectoine/hydroxyectoine ABC transporter substrate-binding protein EhuB [Streptomyces griseiscabiei]